MILACMCIGSVHSIASMRSRTFVDVSKTLVDVDGPARNRLPPDRRELCWLGAEAGQLSGEYVLILHDIRTVSGG